MAVNPDAALQARLDRGWTARELARRSGVSVGTIRNIETGRNEPTTVVLHAIADALGVDVSTLQGDQCSAGA